MIDKILHIFSLFFSKEVVHNLFNFKIISKIVKQIWGLLYASFMIEISQLFLLVAVLLITILYVLICIASCIL